MQEFWDIFFQNLKMPETARVIRAQPSTAELETIN